MPDESPLAADLTLVVQESDTAFAAGGQGYPRVLGTPRMIGWMERAGHNALVDRLNPGQTSVGVMVNVRHLAATPVGMEVRVRAELIRSEGRRYFFRIEAWDEVEKVGEGEHERFVIDWDRFNQRLDEKRQK